MRLFSYVVVRDYGFAPNPFFGICTLATCKPDIRSSVRPGDWIVGTGSKTKNRHDNLVYGMRVEEIITFNEYWGDIRFQRKKARLAGSLKQAFGDNIYLRTPDGRWQQTDSHHSIEHGVPNLNNIRRDTKTDRVLIGKAYAYWGGAGPEIPLCFREWGSHDICKSGPGHKCQFPDAMVEAFVAWFMAREERGFLGEPLDWKGLI